MEDFSGLSQRVEPPTARLDGVGEGGEGDEYFVTNEIEGKVAVVDCVLDLLGCCDLVGESYYQQVEFLKSRL